MVAVEPEAIANIIDPSIVKPIIEHIYYDVGSFCLYSESDMEKVFKHGSFGRYTDE